MKQILQQFTLRASLLVMLLVGAIGNAWGEEKTVTIVYTNSTKSVFTPTLPTSSSSANSSATSHVVEGLSIKEASVYTNTAGYMMFIQNKGYLYNTESLGTIKSVAVTYSNGCSTTAKVGVYFGAEELSTYTTTTNKTISGVGKTDTWNNSVSGNGYFQLSTSNKNCQITKIEIKYDEGGSTTETVATPTFSPAAGTYTSAQNVTISTETSGAIIYYTTDGANPTTSSSTYSSAINVSQTTTIKAMAVKDGMTNSAIAEAMYTITQPLTTMDEIFAAATQAGNTATPKVVTFNNWVVTGVKNSNAYVTDGTKGFIIYQSGHGFNVGDVLSGTASCRIQLYKGAAEITDLSSSTSGLTVTTGGTVTPVTTISIADLSGINTGAIFSYENLAYDGTNLSDGTNTIRPFNSLYDYSMTNGKSYNVTGIYVQYDETKEILPRSEEDIEEVVITVPVINSSDVEIVYNATSGSISYTIDNGVEGTNLEATTNADWISNIVVGESEISFDCTANNGNEDRTATLTLTYGDVTKEITVTQKHLVVDYAELPFEWEGGASADFLALNGVTANGLGSDYASNNNPYLIKFDGTGDYIQIKTNERPGTVTIGVKMIGGANSSSITVQESSDGETFTDVQELTISGAQNSVVNLETFADFAETSRYVRLYFTKGSNVGVGPITIAQYTAPLEYTLTVSDLSHVNLFVFGGDESETIIEGEGTAQVSNGTNVEISVDVETGYVLQSLIVDDTDVTSQIDQTTGMYVFVMPNHDVTITATALEETITPVTGAKYVKVTSANDLTSGQYLIVYKEGSVAFNGGLGTLDAAGNTIEVVLNNNEIAATTETTAAEFTIDVTEGTIKSASGLYIGQTSNANGLASSATTAYTNTLSIGTEGDANIVSSGGAYLRYNATSGQDRFRYFKSSTYTSQKAIQLYKKVEESPAITVTIGSVGYTTFVAPADVNFPEGVEAFIVTTISTSSIHMEPVTAVPSGTPVVVRASEGTHELSVATETDDVTDNLLLASDGNVTGDGTIYALGNKSAGVGFYPVKSGANVPEGKAYLVVNNENIKEFFSFDFGGLVTEINNVNTDFDTNAEIYNLAGQRVQKVQKGFYIVGGKKVLVK